MTTYHSDHGQGDRTDLGVITMRLLVGGAGTDGRLGVAEFRGGEGPWTVAHVHERTCESFYVLDGAFTFRYGDEELALRAGGFLVVPPGTAHAMRAGAGGGALLALFAPAGLEEMFLELGRLPADAILDPAVRAEVAQRHDSIPV